MNAYKVEATTELGETVVHVTATTREKAVYEAFNEVTDTGGIVKSLGDVYVLGDDNETWSLIASHRELSKMVG